MNRPFFIVGCQRSGTTLLNLILNSHPEIHGVDEMDFDPARMREYLYTSAYRPCVAFKLPTATHTVSELKTFPGAKFLWSLRDPRQVVASMLELGLTLEGTLVPWLEHPQGGPRELENCWRVLADTADARLRELVREHKAIDADAERRRSRPAQVYRAALSWRLKQAVFPLYTAAGLDLRIVRYENLVRAPRDEVTQILDFLELAWHADVLRHHRLHEGRAVGRTENTRAIDEHSLDKWVDTLSGDDVAIIRDVCSDAAGPLGYDLS